MQRFRKTWLLWLPPVLLLTGILLYKPLLLAEQFAADHIFFCPFHALTGFYCPGCGGTRSMTALLHGHLLLALHENPAVPALLLMALLFYAERLAAFFGKTIRLLPRQNTFWIAAGCLHLLWAILRNCIPFLQPFT